MKHCKDCGCWNKDRVKVCRLCYGEKFINADKFQKYARKGKYKNINIKKLKLKNKGGNKLDRRQKNKNQL